MWQRRLVLPFLLIQSICRPLVVTRHRWRACKRVVCSPHGPWQRAVVCILLTVRRFPAVGMWAVVATLAAVARRLGVRVAAVRIVAADMLAAVAADRSAVAVVATRVQAAVAAAVVQQRRAATNNDNCNPFFPELKKDEALMGPVLFCLSA